ncbi:hypothetical protein FRB94_001096 [Tulasnella sp. JGI-2019a]|nr:hypothetical protein FRB94_001096 [Tulasnella sp. JGI-2019a]
MRNTANLSETATVLTYLQCSIEASPIPEPFKSAVATLPSTALLVLKTAQLDKKRYQALTELAVYIATLTETIVRPLLNKPPEDVDESMAIQVEAFHREMENVLDHMETLGSRPLFSRMFKKTDDVLTISGFSGRIQKIITIFQLETNVALRVQVNDLRREMRDMVTAVQPLSASASRIFGMAAESTRGSQPLLSQQISETPRPMRSLPPIPAPQPEQTSPSGDSVLPITTIQEMFPDIDPTLLSAIADHTLAAADLHKLARPSNREHNYDADQEDAHGAARSKSGRGLGTKTYPNLSSILEPHTTYFAILIRTVPQSQAGILGAATMQYINDIRSLSEEYEWYAVLQYHFAFFRRRRQEMCDEAEFGRWAFRDEELMSRYLSGHPKSTPQRRSPSGNAPRGGAAHGGRNSTDSVTKRGSVTRSVKGGNRNAGGEVCRVYSIGSCPQCKNEKMKGCPTCQKRHSLPVEPAEEHEVVLM